MSAAGKKCPLLKKICIEGDCSFWTQLRGQHPQTGEPVDEYDCAIRWAVVTNIEIAQKVNQLGGAIESFRNEMVDQNNGSAAIIAQGVKRIDRTR